MLQAWTALSRRPVDTVAILTAIAVSTIVVVNAVFLQSGMRAAPLFDANKSASVKSDSLKPLVTSSPMRPVATSAVVQPVVARRNDAIAELIGPSARIAAVQRALSDLGYGQIKASGPLDQRARCYDRSPDRVIVARRQMAARLRKSTVAISIWRLISRMAADLRL